MYVHTYASVPVHTGTHTHMSKPTHRYTTQTGTRKKEENKTTETIQSMIAFKS